MAVKLRDHQIEAVAAIVHWPTSDWSGPRGELAGAGQIAVRRRLGRRTARARRTPSKSAFRWKTDPPPAPDAKRNGVVINDE